MEILDSGEKNYHYHYYTKSDHVLRQTFKKRLSWANHTPVCILWSRERAFKVYELVSTFIQGYFGSGEEAIQIDRGYVYRTREF